jgi:choline dehydrogenase
VPDPGWDVIVCGGGTAGPVVAARAAEAGARVLLLEAGPDYGRLDDGRWPAELTDASTIPTSHDWGYVSDDARPLPFERAKVIGGCSAHNGCTVSWGHRADYDGWGLPGWSADELAPLFAEASRRLRTRRFGDDELTPFHRGFIDAGAELGLPVVDDLETLDGVPGVGAEPSNSPGGIRWNAAFAYLDPVRDLPHLEVRGDTLVDRVLVQGGRAVGVRAIGPGRAVGEVAADQIVLTAGTYGSPSILLRSGIGPAEPLRTLGVEPIVDLPGVGANLHDHPAFEVSFAPSDELERRTAAFAVTDRAVPDEQGLAKAASSWARDGVFDMHVFSEVAMDRRLGIFVACVTPRSRGRLSLRGLDPSAAPGLDHAYLSDPEGHDLGVLTEGIELARRFADAPSMAPLLAGELEPGPVDDLATAIRARVIHYWHPVGTCALGKVADEQGRIRGVDGLIVADASAIPRTPRATTNLPTIVVAERIARFLTV